MATFLLVHRHPQDYTGSNETVAAWIAWFKELGTSVEDLGNPVFERTAVGNCGADAQLGGYTLVTTNDLEGAVALANRCQARARLAGAHATVTSA